VYAVDEGERLQRGSSFGAVARAYAAHRPDYPRAAVLWALGLPGGPARQDGAGPAAGRRILDLGAGTGKLTEVLLSLGAEVTAVEPDLNMLGELRRLFPQARALEGSAEAIPLPDASVDAVLCGQAMHWFDMTRAIPEIARVLVNGGPLAGLWNADDDRAEWVAGLQSIARDAAAPSLSRRRAEAADFGVDQFGLELFGPAERADFAHGQAHTAESLVALLATHSRILVMPSAMRSALLAEVARYLASRPETTEGDFLLPMVTMAVRALRRPAVPPVPSR
jgi:SAM-dependent methyltransferase